MSENYFSEENVKRPGANFIPLSVRGAQKQTGVKFKDWNYGDEEPGSFVTLSLSLSLSFYLHRSIYSESY